MMLLHWSKTLCGTKMFGETKIGMPEKFGELKSFINQILIFGEPSLYRPTNLANINMPADVLYRVNTVNRLVACDVQPKSHIQDIKRQIHMDWLGCQKLRVSNVDLVHVGPLKRQRYIIDRVQLIRQGAPETVEVNLFQIYTCIHRLRALVPMLGLWPDKSSLDASPEREVSGHSARGGAQYRNARFLALLLGRKGNRG